MSARILLVAVIASLPVLAQAAPEKARLPHLPDAAVCSIRQPSQRSEAETRQLGEHVGDLSRKIRDLPPDSEDAKLGLLKEQLSAAETAFGCESSDAMHALDDYAEALSQHGDFDEALRAERRALNISRDSFPQSAFDLWRSIITLASDAERPSEALGYTEQALREEPDLRPEQLQILHDWVADVHTKLTEDAALRAGQDRGLAPQQALQQLQSLDQSNQTVLMTQGRLLEEKGDLRGAEAVWRELSDNSNLSNNLARQGRYGEAIKAGADLIDSEERSWQSSETPRTPAEEAAYKSVMEAGIKYWETEKARLEASGKKDEAALAGFYLENARGIQAGGNSGSRNIRMDWARRVQVARWSMLVNNPQNAAMLLRPACGKLRPTLEDLPDESGVVGSQTIVTPADCFTVLAEAEARLSKSGIDEASARAFEAAQSGVESASGLALSRAVGREYVLARGGADIIARIDRATADSKTAATAAEGATSVEDTQKLLALVTKPGGLAPGTAQAYQVFMQNLMKREAIPMEATQKAANERRAAFEDLGKRFPAYLDIVAPKPLALVAGTQGNKSAIGASLPELLSPNEAMVVWMVPPGGEHGLVFVVSRQKAAWASLSLSGDEIDAMVATLRRQIDPCGYGAGNSDCHEGLGFDRQIAWKLFQTLLGDQRLQAVWNVPDITSLLIVPSGSTTSLPPGLLLTAAPNAKGLDDSAETLRDEAWLIRSKSVAILPSVSTLRTLRVVLPTIRKSSNAVGGLFMIADPDFGGRAQQSAGCKKRSMAPSTAKYTGSPTDKRSGLASLCRLPGTRDEAALLKQQIPGIVLTDGDAREAQLRTPEDVKALGSARVVAFATHGLLAGDLGVREPALALAAPRADETTDDGFLTASKAAGLRLSAEWVILSACNTASPEAGARGLSGLARGFFYAGARNLLVSHWRTDDQLSGVIVNEVIRLEHTGLSKAEALRRASVEMLDRKLGPTDDDRTAHPRAWAPFVVIGDGR